MNWLVLATSVLLAMPPREQPPDDGQAHFPALQTTIVNPEVEGRAMTECTVFDGNRLCGDELGDAWCRANGFGGGFVDWATQESESAAACGGAARCSVVREITCKGVPIVGD